MAEPVRLTTLGKLTVIVGAAAAIVAGFTALGPLSPWPWLVTVAAVVGAGWALGRGALQPGAAGTLAAEQRQAEESRRALARGLPFPLKQRLARFEDKGRKLLEMGPALHLDELTQENARLVVDKLQWAYTRLLVGRHNVEPASAGDAPPSPPEGAADPRAEQRRELDAALLRLEQQVDGAIHAAATGQVPLLLASSAILDPTWLDMRLTTDAQATLAALDQALPATPAPPPREPPARGAAES